MSIDTHNIPPIEPTQVVRAASSALAAAEAAAAASDDGSVKLDTMPSAPPPEVLDAVGRAARAYDRLTAHGVQLQFQIDSHTGRVALHVYDEHGTVLGTLSPSQVLDIAAGGTLE
jgi:hypothetical protein